MELIQIWEDEHNVIGLRERKHVCADCPHRAYNKTHRETLAAGSNVNYKLHRCHNAPKLICAGSIQGFHN